jgi:hypothetical protein
VISKSPVFLSYCVVLFSYLSYLFTQKKLHADRTSWNGCFAVVHLSRFTLQVVPFVPDVLFLHLYFNASSMHVFPGTKAMQHPNLIFLDKSQSPDQTYIFCSPVLELVFSIVYNDLCMCTSMFT